ncbi:MAG TPA: HAMP domain-containing sensor histidine kinase [Anaeromyxobacteraceae bacterium]|nr:HAMP domain-containing sensor histidine kinase [Anaeromyxobacteraceae bacterium]
MLPRATSIRGKIASGYLLSFLFLLLVATVLFVSLNVAEDEVKSYFGVSRFLDTALEMRRYEKNYLLYGQREDLEAALRFAESAGALMAARAGAPRHPRWLGILAGVDGEAGPDEATPERTAALLGRYAALLRTAGAGRAGDGPRPAPAVEADVRELGRRITGIAERLASVEGRNVQGMLRSGRRAVILLVVLSLVGTVAIARVVRSTAIRPLQEMEAQMERIASGDTQPLPEASGSDEINSMNRAFNRMIREVAAHRQEKVQSERLASLGTMLAGIAHEINNPLSNVSTSAEILKEENERAGPRERRVLIDQIISQTDRATDIIRTVLDFSRQDRGERRSTNLLSAVRGSMLLVRGEMPAHVSVDVDVAPDIEIPSEKAKLEQAFINLITNSIDAMRDAGRESRIAISARPAGDQDVEIVFRDTGAGIPPDLLDRVFDPFFTTKDVGQGTGLGLYLTHHIVEQAGGTIRVESAVGQGTAFVIRLPRGEPRRAAPGAATGGEGSA